jgi:hypothetical protein
LSLRRLVALKILLFAAMLDERQLQRFCNEARGCGRLASSQHRPRRRGTRGPSIMRCSTSKAPPWRR